MKGISVAFGYQLAFSGTFIGIVGARKIKGRWTVICLWSTSDAAVYHIDVVVVTPAYVAALLVALWRTTRLVVEAAAASLTRRLADDVKAIDPYACPAVIGFGNAG